MGIVYGIDDMREFSLRKPGSMSTDLQKHGLPVTISRYDDTVGKLILIAACPDRETAERIREALKAQEANT